MTASGPAKLFYLAFGIVFLALGILGLILPFMPGIVFLAVAVYLLSRGSRYIGRLAEEHPKLRRLQRRMDQVDAADIFRRVQTAALVTIESVVTGLRKVYLGVRRMLV